MKAKTAGRGELRRSLPAVAPVLGILMTAAALTIQAAETTAPAAAEQPRELRVGDRVLGHIAAGGGSDSYALIIEAPMTVVIRMEKVLGSTIDPKIRVIDAHGDEIGSDDDDGGDLDAQLALMLRPGRYTIAAQAVGTGSGDYALRVEEQVVHSLSLGAVILGNMDENTREMLFRVSVPKRTRLRVAMCRVLGSEIDPKVAVADTQGREIGTDDDGGEGLNALLRRTVEPGSYLVTARRAGTSGGQYLLAVTDEDAPPIGSSIAVGGRFAGTVIDPSQPVVAMLHIGAEVQDVRILADRAGASELDPFLIVVDSAGNIVGSDDDSGNDTDAMLRLPLARGDYQIFVGSYGTSAGGFALSVETDHLPELALRQSIHGELGPRASDMYRFVAERDMDILIDVEKSVGKAGTAELDPKVTLRSLSGAEIGSDDDSGEDNNARLSLHVTRRAYAVVVSGYGRAGGGYTITVHEPATRDLGAVRVGEQRSGAIASSGERHVYHLQLAQPTAVAIDLEAPEGSELDPKVALRRENGEEIADDDDGGERSNARISRRLAAGTYAIIAMGYGSKTGGYVLSVAAQDVGTVEVGMRRLGAIRQAGGEDHYTYAVPTQQAVIIRAEQVLGSTIDPLVVIYDANGNEIARDDDSGEGTNARLRQMLEPGDYDIMVRGVGSSMGDYVLAVERVVDISDASLPTVALGDRKLGRILSGDQIDRYHLVLDRPTNVMIRLDKLGNSRLDPKLAVQSEDGAELESDDDDGGNSNALIRRNLAAGQYFIVAQGYGDTAGEYALSIDEEHVAERDLGPLTGERTIEDTIGASGERAAFTFSLHAAAYLTISMEHTTSELDPYLELYQADGEQVATDDDDGSGTNALIEQNLEPGHYRVITSGYSGSTGPYRLAFYFGERTTSERQQGAIGMNETRSGEIPARGRDETRDAWRLMVPVRSQVEIHLDAAENSEIDPYLRIMDDAGTELASDDDGGEGTNALIRRDLTPGAYTIVASGYTRSTGSYVLRVSSVTGGGVLSFEESDHGLGVISDPTQERALAIGKYSFRAIRGDHVASTPESAGFTAGVVGVAAVCVEGPERQGYGLAFRITGRGDNLGCYAFEIDASGEYRLVRRARGRVIDIIPWTGAAAIEKGRYAQNILRVEANGPDFTLSINGTEVGRATDTTYVEGMAGLSVSEGLRILFDDLEIPQEAGVRSGH